MRGPSTSVAAILFTSLTLLLSAPLALHLGDAAIDPDGIDATWSRADYDLTAWILAWGSHALSTAPSTFFDGNIFHPAENTLAGSENLLGVQPIAAPVFILTGNAVLTQNVTLLLLVALSGFTTFIAARGFTKNPVAGLVAGILFAFAPQVTGDWTRIHWAAVSLLPAITWTAFEAARAPGRGRLVALGAMIILQIAAGIYVAYGLAVWLLALAPGLFVTARKAGRSPVPVYLAIVVAGAITTPLALPYLRHGVAIDPDTLAIILAATSPKPGSLASSLFEQLGPAGIFLAGFGLVTAFRQATAYPPGRTIRFSLLAGALLGFVLATGIHLAEFHALLRAVVPGFGSIRGPGRFFTLTILGTALLAGLGTADLVRLAASSRPRRAAALAWASAATVFLHAILQPGATAHELRTMPHSGESSAVYQWLAESGDHRALLELPVHRSSMEPAALAATGRAMLGATIHWQPLLGGYTGHPPANAALTANLAARLPDARAFADLCRFTDLGWILVRPAAINADRRNAWRNHGLPLALVGTFPGSRLYRVEAPCGTRTDRLRAELEGGYTDRTLRDTPLDAPLEVDATLSFEKTRRLVAGVQHWIPVEVRNRGNVTWPGLSTHSNGRFGLQARWRIPGQPAPRYNDRVTPLATDLAPGESLELEVAAFAPRIGRHVLEIGLVREGSGWIADEDPSTGAILRSEVETVPREEARN